MIIQPKLEPSIIDEYDILFAGGFPMPLTVEKDKGDTIDFDTDPLVVRIHIAPRPMQSDPSRRTPAEDVTIFMNQVLSITHRTREATPPTPDQTEQFKLLHKLHPTVQ